MVYSCSFVFYFLRIKQHLSSDEISNPSVITSSPSSFTTPIKHKINPTSKISPLPPFMNHPIPNNRILNSKLRSLTEPSKPTHSHNFVIKNIFNNTKAITPKAAFSPPLKSPPLHNPVQSKHPPFPLSDSSAETQNSPPDPTSDPMLLQIPIKLLQKRPNSSPVHPQEETDSDCLFPEQNGYTENTQEASILKKRPKPSSPNCLISKKTTPNSPTETHKQFATKSDDPILENGDTHLLNGDVDTFNWDEPAELATSQKDESPIDDNLASSATPVDENFYKRVSHIEHSEFPFISISLRDKVDACSVESQSIDYPPKTVSPTVNVPAIIETPTTPITEELCSKKLKRSSKERTQIPTCQWHNCQR